MSCYPSILIVLALLLFCSTPAPSPFNAYQYILWSGNSVPFTISLNSTTVALPSPFLAATYNRSVVLAGLRGDYAKNIAFSLGVSTLSDTNLNIIMGVGNLNYLYTVSVYVVLVNATSDWTWMVQSQHIFLFLSDINYAGNQQNFTANGPPVIVGGTEGEFQVHAMLRGMEVASDVNAAFDEVRLGLQITVRGVAASDAIHLKTTRTGYASYTKIFYVVILIRDTQSVFHSTGSFSLDYSATSSNRLTNGINMGIPSVYGSSPTGGYDGRCMIGFNSLRFGGAGLSALQRSVLFNATANYFTDVWNTIQNKADGTVEYFDAQWRVLCMMTCFMPDSYYNAGTCTINNQVDNCNTSLTSTVCLDCLSGYFLLNASYCENCNVSVGCLTCQNQSYCESCQSSAYALNSSNYCQLCSTFIDGCLYCSSDTVCTACVNDTLHLASPTLCQQCSITYNQYCLSCNNIECFNCSNQTYRDNGNCHLCNTTLDNCTHCNDSNTCTQCVPSFIPIAASGQVICQPCVNYINNCFLCYDQNDCVECQDNYVEQGGQCVACSLVITDCSTCLNGSYCTACNNDFTYLYAVSASSQFCFVCAIAIPNCLTCLSDTYCTSCLNASYYLTHNHTGQCLSCISEDANCQECSTYIHTDTFSYFRCDLCASQLYFLNSTTNRCQLCSSAINECSLCSNQTYCTQCVNNTFAFDVNSVSCQPCSSLYPNCQECDSTKCTKCLQGLHSLDGGLSCQCVLGQYVSGLCIQVTGCTSAVPLQGGGYSCQACDTALYHQYPVDGVCVCLSGTLINGICCDISGCIVPQISLTGAMSCLFCNVSVGFLGTPVNNQCLCRSKYELNSTGCVQICGDGFYLGSYGCDDGNLQDGDGCSSTCTVQLGYRCYNGSSETPSSCVYEGIPLQVTLQTIKKHQDLNQGIFAFSMSPALININKMDLYQHVQLICNGSQYNVSSISYDSSGVLTLKADYSTDMEGKSCRLDLSFDSSYIRSPNTSVSFEAVSKTLPLIIITKQEEYQTIKLIFGILGYIAVGIFAVSLGHKMIGAETITCSILVYLSNVLYQKPYFFFNEVKRLKLVTGYWSLFYSQSYGEVMAPFSERVELTPSFLEDSALVLGILGFAVIVWLILSLYSYCTKPAEDPQNKDNKDKNNTDQEESEAEPTRTEKIADTVYQYLIFPISAGFMIVLMVAAYYDILVTDSSSSSLPQLLSPVAMLLTWLILGVVFGIEFIDTKCIRKKSERGLRGMKQVEGCYIRIFLGRAVLMAFLIDIGVTSQYNTLVYFILLLQLAYFVIILISRPYHKCIDNLGLIFCQACALYALALPAMMRFVQVEESIQMYMTLVLQSLLVVVFAFSLLRLALHYKNMIVRRPAVEEKADIQMEEVKNTESKGKISKKKKKAEKTAKMLQQQNNQLLRVNPYSQYTKSNAGLSNVFASSSQTPGNRKNLRKNSYADKHKKAVEQQRQEDPELTAIKNRLREDLLTKKRRQ